MAFVEMMDSYKEYKIGENKIVANNKINFSIEKGEFVIIVGPSGAGKSTVLNILGGMDKNDSGQVLVDGKDISKFNDKELTAYRRYDIGFVFQFYNLISNLTAKIFGFILDFLVDVAHLNSVFVAGCIMLQEGQRRLPVQYAKRVVGNKVYGGQSTFIPLRAQ